MNGLIILAILVIIQIIIFGSLAFLSIKFFRHARARCKTNGFMCKNKSNWELCNLIASYDKNGVKNFDKEVPPIFKDTCCGNPPNSDTWMTTTATLEKDQVKNGFEKNCMNS